MQLKVSTDYAIRIVLYMATTMKINTSKELSDKLGIQQSIVLKIGKNLSDNGIINITTGVHGGFLLKKQPEDISLFDVINIFEPTTKLNRCLEEDRYCSRFATENCPVRKVYCKMQLSFENDLKNTSIKELL
ncbi:Rrf2 family transcriptional regulator [Clostridium sp.]|uniref:RrF2 family transcriptional regulator n=1 Tax=Clostridium sp. TaxID=1506 RepID=UPI00290E14E4|nr:Rrf2 family transcriptional regulator [Clostridium sp.]MDU6522138.1 Rrf2 family transcriptional regulator [Clostridium sp.]